MGQNSSRERGPCWLVGILPSRPLKVSQLAYAVPCTADWLPALPANSLHTIRCYALNGMTAAREITAAGLVPACPLRGAMRDLPHHKCRNRGEGKNLPPVRTGPYDSNSNGRDHEQRDKKCHEDFGCQFNVPCFPGHPSSAVFLAARAASERFSDSVTASMAAAVRPSHNEGRPRSTRAHHRQVPACPEGCPPAR